MALIPDYFDLEELVCKDVFTKYRQTAWQFFDPRLIVTIDWIRRMIGKPMYANSWDSRGKYDERGLRCIKCPLVRDAFVDGSLYASPHIFGQAVDFDVQGMVAEEVRQWLITRKNQLPYPIRLESGVSWVHLDVRDTGQKVYLFNP